jgi:hypothetical protein
MGESAIRQSVKLFARFFKGESPTIIKSMITALDLPSQAKADIKKYIKKEQLNVFPSNIEDMVRALCVLCPTIIKKRCTPAFGEEIKRDIKNNVLASFTKDMYFLKDQSNIDAGIGFITATAPLSYMKEPLKQAKKRAFEYLDDRSSRNWAGIQSTGGFEKAMNNIFGFLGL